MGQLMNKCYYPESEGVPEVTSVSARDAGSDEGVGAALNKQKTLGVKKVL